MSAQNYYKLNINASGLSFRDIQFFNTLKEYVDSWKQIHRYQCLFEKIGFEVLGPILYGYSVWLHEQVEITGADTLIFLSREGKILKRAYEAIFDRSNAETEYINVSRLSLSKATILETVFSWKEFQDKYATLLRGLTKLEELMDLLDIEASDEKYKSFGLDKRLSLEEIYDKERIFGLIKNCGVDSLKKQHHLATEYLKSKGIGKGKTIISDIGWSGTMQILLEDLFPNERFNGCYIAVGDIYRSKRYQELDRKGFWFDSDDHKRWQMIRFTESAIESLFLNNEGTTTGYKKREGQFAGEAEDSTDVEPIKRVEKKDFEAIEIAHDAAIQFINHIGSKLNISMSQVVNKDVWFIPYMNFALCPNRETLDFYHNMSFIDASKEYGFLPEHNLIYYLFHPKKMLAELNLNNGKVIWLYGLLRLPLPYFKILCFMTGKLRMKSKYEKRYLKGNKVR